MYCKKVSIFLKELNFFLFFDFWVDGIVENFIFSSLIFNVVLFFFEVVVFHLSLKITITENLNRRILFFNAIINFLTVTFFELHGDMLSRYTQNFRREVA